MKQIAKNLREGISWQRKVLLAIFGLLTLIISPNVIDAAVIKDGIREMPPFDSQPDLVINNVEATKVGEQYQLYKEDTTKEYQIDLVANSGAGLKSGLFPIKLTEVSQDQEALIKYYQKYFFLE